MSFEVIDISGDAGIRAWGKNLEELFASAALGMYSLITDTSAVKTKNTLRITLDGRSQEALMVGWLNELIFHFDAYGFVGREIEIKELTGDKADNRIDAVVKGEDFDPSRHEKRLLLKAATYHNLRIEKKGGLLQADIIFDI